MFHRADGGYSLTITAGEETPNRFGSSCVAATGMIVRNNTRYDSPCLHVGLSLQRYTGWAGYYGIDLLNDEEPQTTVERCVYEQLIPTSYTRDSKTVPENTTAQSANHSGIGKRHIKRHEQIANSYQVYNVGNRFSKICNCRHYMPPR